MSTTNQSLTIQQCLYKAKNQLGSVADCPLFEAELLLAHAMGKTRSFLYAWPENQLTQKEFETFTAHVRRRCSNEPIAYISGFKEFWSLELSVNKETLIPRPETELLVETILTLVTRNKSFKLADLGTGSGAIAIALAKERPNGEIYATDINKKALEMAKHNARTFCLDNINFASGHWFGALPCSDFDIIVSNPPYIAELEWKTYANGLEFEPREALVSGQDGLDAIRELSQGAKNYLKVGGYLLLEHGFRQAELVHEIFVQSNFKKIRSLLDLGGKKRVTVGCYYP